MKTTANRLVFLGACRFSSHKIRIRPVGPVVEAPPAMTHLTLRFATAMPSRVSVPADLIN